MERIWTVPNVLSFARLAGVPLFLWLILAKQDYWALSVLVLAGLSDWADGKLARVLNQTSRLGTLLDPAADRLYIFATVLGLLARGLVPWWIVIALVARELFVGVVLVIVKRYGYVGLPVHFVGKSATAGLLYAFPLLLLGDHVEVAKVIGWAFVIWGTALYWWAAVLYVVQARQLISAVRMEPHLGGSTK